MTAPQTPAQGLAQVPLFAALPAEELEALSAHLRQALFPAGAYLAYEGERGDQFYLILEGQLEVLKAEGTPEARRVGVRGPGEYVGEMSLFNPDSARTASVRACAPTRVLEVTRADLHALLQRHPPLAFEMVRVMSQRLTSAHDNAIRDLQAKNQQLASAYDALKAAQAQIIENERLERELQVAASIQLSILPHALPQRPGLDLGAVMAPARVVGGDFYDVIPLDDDRLGMVVGDVTDKGMPAAIFMARAHAFWRAEAARGGAPSSVLQRVNAHLSETNAKELFVTMIYGILNHRTGEFTYARAGHEAPLVCGPDGALVEIPFNVGQPLAVLSEPELDAHTVMLPAGGLAVLFTDGLTEALDAARHQFGEARLMAVLGAQAEAGAQALCDRLQQAVAAHRGATPQSDDLTLLVAHWTG